MWHGLLFAAVLAFPAHLDGKLQRYEFRARHMGVAWKIALYAPNEAVANTAAKAAFGRIGELNKLFSDYEPDSELMRLCRTSRPGKPVKVSRELFEVLSHAQAVSKDSGGAFDVTVGHMTHLWRNARRRKRFPRPEVLQSALKKTGYRFIKLDPKNRAVELLKPAMRLDLGGIAKGYAGDAALAVLKKRGIARAMIDGSGDIVVGDPPPGRAGWKIAVESLRSRKRPARILTLKNRAVATSGDAYQFIEFHGKRYSHIVDPKTGFGLTQRSSVTVVAPAGWQADAYASAVSVLGPERGVKLIETKRGFEASITVLRNAKPVTVQTRGFKRFLAE
jgi:FAD:protein FMN transferase